jgi:hypothetical protein
MATNGSRNVPWPLLFLAKVALRGTASSNRGDLDLPPRFNENQLNFLHVGSDPDWNFLICTTPVKRIRLL